MDSQAFWFVNETLQQSHTLHKEISPMSSLRCIAYKAYKKLHWQHLIEAACEPVPRVVKMAWSVFQIMGHSEKAEHLELFFWRNDHVKYFGMESDNKV